MKKSFFNFLILLVLILPIYLTFFANKNQIKSASILNNIKDQLSSAQLSFVSKIGDSNTGGLVSVSTSDNPSNGTINLAPGDMVYINSGIDSNTYPIQYILNNTQMMLGDLDNGQANVANNDIGSTIIAKRYAVHTISYISDASVVNADLQYFIKATDYTEESPTDAIPDQGGFDMGTLTASDVTCPNGSHPTEVIIQDINFGLIYDGNYITFDCLGIGISAGDLQTVTVGDPNGGQLINPAPSRGHTIGQVDNNHDVYWMGIAPSDQDGNLLGLAFSRVAVSESVRVTATVDRILTFTIGTSNVTTVGTNLCGSPLSIGATNTTATSVNFGVLPLITNNNLAQKLSIVTNSTNGYVIQTYENSALKTTIGQSIPDTTCGGNNCSSTTSAPWTNFTDSGFGYSIEVGNTTADTINQSTANISIGITTLGDYKAFGVGSSNAEAVLSRNDTPSGTDSIYMCYRVVAGADQEPGYYENSVSYIATATF